MRHFLGLDIGSTTIRAARVTRSFNRFQVRDTQCLPYGAESLRQLREEGRDHGEMIVASLPETAVLSRRVSLPFTDPEKLARVVPFELEELLPVDLETVAVDFELLSSKDHRAVVLAMAVAKAVLLERLDLLRQAELSIDKITVPSLGLAAYYRQFMQGRDTALLLNIDADGGLPVVTLCAVDQHRLWDVRTFLAGSALTPAVPLWSELARTVETWSKERGELFERLYVAGACTDPALYAFLNQKLGIATIEPCAGKDGCDTAFVVAAGLATLAGEQRSGRINFARDHVRHAARSNRPWRTAAVGMCAILVLAILSVGLRHRDQQSRYDQLVSAVHELVERSFPGAADADATRQAKGVVAEARKRSLALGIGNPSLLQLLSELTRHIPSDTRTEIKEVLVDAERLWIEAETDSFDSVERIKAELARSVSFVNVAVHDARTAGGATRVRFRLQMMIGHG